MFIFPDTHEFLYLMMVGIVLVMGELIKSDAQTPDVNCIAVISRLMEKYSNLHIYGARYTGDPAMPCISCVLSSYYARPKSVSLRMMSGGQLGY
jgi:hypothetical protein